jgi:hypothetical protein
MEKQTAVEWLSLRYHHRQGYLSQEDINEAREMEKEQMKIELPSNQEINEKSFEYYNNDFWAKLRFKKGAKYVIDKIQRGNL